jgi:hypothetical protein
MRSRTAASAPGWLMKASEHGALQRMLQLRDGLAGVLFATLVGEQLFDVLEAQAHGKE